MSSLFGRHRGITKGDNRLLVGRADQSSADLDLRFEDLGEPIQVFPTTIVGFSSKEKT
jgi:hypothetical protein